MNAKSLKQKICRHYLCFFYSYHVSKVGHAKAVGLVALISHDVVLQHQSAVVEPDFPCAEPPLPGSCRTFLPAK